LGKALPLLAAVLVPLMALGLYLHFGAADKVELTQEFAEAPKSMEEMTTRLNVVQAQPDSAEAMYLLGRAYMAEQRPADAARTFERAGPGRPPAGTARAGPRRCTSPPTSSGARSCRR
jgi:cytochrome c-type biogenesis protein CcmH